MEDYIKQTKMVCEIAQHEAFQKVLTKKIEKLKKHLEKAENDLDEQMIKNEELKRCLDNEAGQSRMYKKKYKKLKKENDRVKDTLLDFEPTLQPNGNLEFAKCRSRWEKENDELRMERDNLRDLYHEELEKDHRPLNEVIQIIDTSTK